MNRPAVPLLRIAGRFHRSVRIDRLAAVLDPPGPESAGRYHRPGQPALYITPEADWAVLAMGRYLGGEAVPRVVVPLMLDEAWVVDQRDAVACALLGIDPDASNASWQAAFAAGDEPPSWRNADRARDAGADGIVDRSRGIAGGWHVTLFRWNEEGTPQVRIDGMPIDTGYGEARSRWPSPEGWRLPDRADDRGRP